ncbi:MAG: hypothetical protein AUH85_14995 [Chloroflexi bacterium 13_1_40CM_4_68_4]|nr:MAG: hypothetical protein AUH85_14995 [Chloroflexi bacterium 13_1_40CM_4_68_4]
MLKLSRDAAKVLNEARLEAEVPRNYGLRIFFDAGPGGADLAIAFAAGPERDDQVSEQDGLPVFVSRDIAEPLEDAVLDIETTDTGVSLVIKMDDEADEIVDTRHDRETPKTSPERLN